MSNGVPLIFVHIGDAVPDYARIAVQQARRWNPETPIYFLSSVKPDYHVGEMWVDISGIPVSPIHAKFNESTILDKDFRQGFWRYTTERLFVLYDWLVSTGTEEFIHLENDNTMYFSIEHLLPYFRENCKGISAPFHGQGNKKLLHICFSIMFCNNVESLEQFLFSLAAAPSRTDEMQRGGEYWLENEDCSLLPCLPPGATLTSEAFRPWYENPAFPYLFDAMAHGQYLGGEDPRNAGPPGPYINPDVDFQPGQFRYKWQVAESGNRYPVLIHKGREWPIANLHIHSKKLEEFI